MNAYPIDKKIAKVLDAAKGKGRYDARWAMELVKVTDDAFIASDKRHIVKLELHHDIPPGLYALDKAYLIPRPELDTRPYPNTDDVWRDFPRVFTRPESDTPSRDFVVTALSNGCFIDPWLFEKTLRALDKLGLADLQVGIETPMDFSPANRSTAISKAELRAKGEHVTVRAMFMGFEFFPMATLVRPVAQSA